MLRFVLFLLLVCNSVLLAAQCDSLLKRRNDTLWKYRFHENEDSIKMEVRALINDARKAGCKEIEAKAYSTLANMAGFAGAYEKSYQLYDTVITLQRQAGDSCGVAAALNNKAYFKSEEGHYDQSIPLLKQAAMLCQNAMQMPGQTPDKRQNCQLTLSKVYQTLSKNFLEYEEYEEALRNARFSLWQLLPLKKGNQYEGEAYNTLANSFYALWEKNKSVEDADSARLYYNKAIALGKEEEPDWLVMVYHNLAMLEMTDKQYEKARELLDSSEALAVNNEDQRGIYDAYVALAQWHEENKAYKNALLYLNRARALEVPNLSLADSLNLAKRFTTAYEANHKPDSALHFSTKAYEIRDKLLSEDKNKLVKKFQLLERENDLAKEKAEKLVAEKNNQLLRFGLLGLFVLSFFVIAYFRQKSKNRYLQGKERALDEMAKSLHGEVQPQLSEAIRMSQRWKQQMPDMALLVQQLSGVREELRRLSHAHGTTILNAVGLTAKIEEDIERLQDTNPDLNIDFVHAGNVRSIGNEKQLHLYRILQLLLDNTIKHAQARHIKIDLHENNGACQLVYEDDGKGFDYKTEMSKTNKSGLKEMKNYAEQLGGAIKFDSTVKHGCKFEVKFPGKKIFALF